MKSAKVENNQLGQPQFVVEYERTNDFKASGMFLVAKDDSGQEYKNELGFGVGRNPTGKIETVLAGKSVTPPLTVYIAKGTQTATGWDFTPVSNQQRTDQPPSGATLMASADTGGSNHSGGHSGSGHSGGHSSGHGSQPANSGHGTQASTGSTGHGAQPSTGHGVQTAGHGTQPSNTGHGAQPAVGNVGHGAQPAAGNVGHGAQQPVNPVNEAVGGLIPGRNQPNQGHMAQPQAGGNPMPAVQPVAPPQPVLGGHAAGSTVPGAQPIPAVIQVPDDPTAPKGTPQYTVQYVVIAAAKGKQGGLSDYISPDATGNLAKLRDGKLDETEQADLRATLGAVRFAGAKTLANGSRLLVLQNNRGQTIQMTVKRRRGKFVLDGMSATPAPVAPAGNVGPNGF